MRSDLPTGTVTFLFTDVEGSTRLLHELGAEAYADALAEHRRVVREACAVADGVEVDTQGDAFFFAFPTAAGAVVAAHAITDAFADGQIHLRIGLHTGTPLVTDEGYVGDDVHFAARVAASGHGGQVLLSKSARELVDGLSVTDLGEHRLKDIEGAVSIYQVGERRFPPLKTLSNTNLPRPASSFLGRERQLAEVLACLERGVRLVTLTGPGGTGKTRLAVEAATTLVSSFKAGVFWVGLASLRDSTLVMETIAQTLGASEVLAADIAEREMLLLLDNLEQVIDAAPELAGLITACPNLTLLCTSREPLRVQGEVEYRVPPLEEAEAVALFCERSHVEAGPEVVEICARLDSLPLAVELAAARATAFTPGQILDRLSGRLDVLRGGRDADARQQTLRATIEWSHDLLSEDERSLFSRISVFADGCTLEAATAVCDADLDILQSLVEKSLVRFTSARYWMLETIREYAAERLAASDTVRQVERRFLEYYSGLAQEASEQGEVGDYDFARIDVERENLRQTLRAAAATDPAAALELAGALGEYWSKRGDFREARAVLANALDAAPAADPGSRARALRWSGLFALKQSELEDAERLAQEALKLYRGLHDHRGAGSTLNVLGSIAMYRNDLTESARLLEASLEEHEAAGGGPGRVVVMANLAAVANATGDHRRAIEVGREVAALSRGRDEHGVAHALCTIGISYEAIGEIEEARRCFEECVAVSREHRFAEAEAYGLASLAHLEQGDFPADALEHYREGLALLREIAEPRGIAYCLEGLASVAILGGDVPRAATLLGAAGAIRERTGATLDPIEQAEVEATIAEGRKAIGAVAFDTASTEGGILDLNQAIDLALT